MLDFGSDTFKAGPVHNFPNEAEPRIVSLPKLRPILILQRTQALVLTVSSFSQVTPAAVQISSSDAAISDQQSGSPDSAKDAARVVQAGQITHWEGFEALVSNILYGQV